MVSENKNNVVPPGGKVHRIMIEWNETTGQVQFRFTTSDAIRNLGMLELAGEQVLQNYRRANTPNITVPKTPVPKM